MAWDKNTPQDTDLVSLGAGEIRQLKQDVEEALRGGYADGVQAIFPGPDTDNPVFRYRGEKGSTGSKPDAEDGGIFFDDLTQTLQRSNGASWDDIGTNIPAGTVMMFYQASAPVGWTKQTTHNDKLLRVVSGTGGGDGGTTGLSENAFQHSHTVSAHTHTIDHRHIANAYVQFWPSNSNNHLSIDVSFQNPFGFANGWSTRSLTVSAYSISRNYAGQFTEGSGFRSTANSDTPNSSAQTGTIATSEYGGIGSVKMVDVIVCSKD